MEVFGAFSSLSSWFTPTSLFLLLNLVIGTIFLTARFGSPAARKHRDSPPPGHDHYQHHHLHHSSSSLLDRVKSINLSLYKFDHQPHPDPQVQDPPRLSRAPSLLERLRSFRSSPEPTQEPEPQPETEKATTQKTMTKSASEKMADGGGEKEEEMTVEKRRPATTRVGAERMSRRERARTESSAVEECVDSRADDFINRFRHQLRLQRLDSLKRFSDMMKGK